MLIGAIAVVTATQWAALAVLGALAEATQLEETGAEQALVALVVQAEVNPCQRAQVDLQPYPVPVAAAVNRLALGMKMTPSLKTPPQPSAQPIVAMAPVRHGF